MEYHVFDFRNIINGSSTSDEDIQLFVYLITKPVLREIARMSLLFHTETSIAAVFDGCFRAYLPLAAHSGSTLVNCASSIVEDYNNSGPTRGMPGTIMTFDDPGLNALNQISQHYIAERSKSTAKASIYIWTTCSSGYLVHPDPLIRCAASLSESQSRLVLINIYNSLSSANEKYIEQFSKLSALPIWKCFSDNLQSSFQFHSIPCEEWKMMSFTRSLCIPSIPANILINIDPSEVSDDLFKFIQSHSLNNQSSDSNYISLPINLTPSVVLPDLDNLTLLSRHLINFECVGSVSTYALSQELMFGLPCHASSNSGCSQALKSVVSSLISSLLDNSTALVLCSNLSPITLKITSKGMNSSSVYYWVMIPSEPVGTNPAGFLLKGLASGDILAPLPLSNCIEEIKDNEIPITSIVTNLLDQIGHPSMSFTPLSLNGRILDISVACPSIGYSSSQQNNNNNAKINEKDTQLKKMAVPKAKSGKKKARNNQICETISEEPEKSPILPRTEETLNYDMNQARPINPDTILENQATNLSTELMNKRTNNTNCNIVANVMANFNVDEKDESGDLWKQRHPLWGKRGNGRSFLKVKK